MQIDDINTMNIEEINHGDLKKITGGFIQYWAAACVISYYMGYGAHYLYDTYFDN